LGLDEIHIGQVLSVCGLMFAVAQYFMYPFIYNRFGLHGAIRLGSMFSAPVMILVPVSVLLNKGAIEGELLPVTFAYLALVIAVSKLFSLVFFASISVALNQSVPFEHRGTVNGLSVQGVSIANGIGPMFAGVLVTVSVSVLGKAGSLLIFGTVAMLGGIATLLVFVYVKEGTDDDTNDGACDGRQFIVDKEFDKSSESIELVNIDFHLDAASGENNDSEKSRTRRNLLSF
jgi:Major Facilitator Superfamily